MAEQSGLSFDIRDARGLFRAFCDAVDEFMRDDLSTRKAVVCAMLGWHIVDWVYAEHPELDSNLRLFQRRVRIECPALSYMRDIATGTKHRATRWPTLRATETHRGAFNGGFNRAFDVSTLRLLPNEGGVLCFDEQLLIVRDYWTGFFADVLAVDV